MPLFPPDAKRDWLLRQDLVVSAEQLATLSELDDADLQSRLSALAVLEQRVSAKRRAIHRVIDQLQQELVRRYKTGEATVEGLLP
jgi:predicted secreted protein